jgi:hypothetical protein
MQNREGFTSVSVGEPINTNQIKSWKSCVRYIQPNQLLDIQTQLQKSLQDTFNCHGQPANLLQELGIPTLKYYRHKDLTRMHYRYLNMGSSKLLYQSFLQRMFQPRSLIPTDIKFPVVYWRVQNKHSHSGKKNRRSQNPIICHKHFPITEKKYLRRT